MNGYFGPAHMRLGLLSAVLVCGSVLGCNHRRIQPVLLPAQTPVAIEPAPALSTPPPLVETPKAGLPPVPVLQEEPKPKKTKKRIRPTQTASAGGAGVPTTGAADKPAGATAPTAGSTATGGKAADAATAGSAAESAAETSAVPASDFGVFSVGGEQNPNSKRDATDLIANNDRRLSGLGAATIRTQAALVSKVRTFQRDAQQALGSGDTEGAKTLATKGKLLLDDLERGVPSQ